MFLQQAMNPWFVIQRTSQVLMILLAVAMLVVPILHQPEADAVPVLLIGAVVAAVIGAGALIYVSQSPECQKCGADRDSTTTDRTTCSYCSKTYWVCQESHSHCSNPSCRMENVDHQRWCGYCADYYYTCGSETHGSNCGS